MNEKYLKNPESLIIGPMVSELQIPWIQEQVTSIENPYPIMAVDGGVDWFKSLGLYPSHLIGDWDSISSEDAKNLFPSAEIQSHPRDKDRTDFALACQWSHQVASPRRVIAIGFLGGRKDHELAVLLECMRWNRARGTEFNLWQRDQFWKISQGQTKLSRGSGFSHFSIISLENDLRSVKVSIQGAQYSGKDIGFTAPSLGISNQFQEDEVTIDSKDHTILIWSGNHDDDQRV